MPLSIFRTQNSQVNSLQQIDPWSVEPIDWQARFKKNAATAQDPRLKAYYEAGMMAADTPISEVPLLALDFETTGLDYRQHGIVSIAATPMRLDRIYYHQAQVWVAKPRRPLLERSVVIHGITHSQIENAPDILEFLPELLEYMAGRVPVVHYRKIERPFLFAALKNRLGEGIEFPVIDTMELEARVYRSKKYNLWQRLKGVDPVSVRLADARARYHLPWYRPHDAKLDTLATGELLQAQVAHHYSPETPVSKLWL